MKQSNSRLLPECIEYDKDRHSKWQCRVIRSEAAATCQKTITHYVRVESSVDVECAMKPWSVWDRSVVFPVVVIGTNHIVYVDIEGNKKPHQQTSQSRHFVVIAMRSSDCWSSWCGFEIGRDWSMLTFRFPTISRNFINFSPVGDCSSDASHASEIGLLLVVAMATLAADGAVAEVLMSRCWLSESSCRERDIRCWSWPSDNLKSFSMLRVFDGVVVLLAGETGGQRCAQQLRAESALVFLTMRFRKSSCDFAVASFSGRFCRYRWVASILGARWWFLLILLVWLRWLNSEGSALITLSLSFSLFSTNYTRL